MSKKSAAKGGKIEFDSSNPSISAQLKKHVTDWFDQHQGVKFISPSQFQNTYPQWDKFSAESCRQPFYAIKKKLIESEINLCHFLFILTIILTNNDFLLYR